MVKGRCRKCGECCRTYFLQVKKADLGIHQIKASYDRAFIHLGNYYVVHKIPCTKLKNGQCISYDERPEICAKDPTPDKFPLWRIVFPQCGYKAR